jgi:hypothetical protein
VTWANDNDTNARTLFRRGEASARFCNNETRRTPQGRAARHDANGDAMRYHRFRSRQAWSGDASDRIARCNAEHADKVAALLDVRRIGVSRGNTPVPTVPVSR